MPGLSRYDRSHDLLLDLLPKNRPTNGREGREDDDEEENVHDGSKFSSFEEPDGGVHTRDLKWLK